MIGKRPFQPPTSMSGNRRTTLSRIPVRVLNDGSRSEPRTDLGAIGDMAFALEQVPLEERRLARRGWRQPTRIRPTRRAQRHFLKQERCPNPRRARTRTPEPPGPSRYNEVLPGRERWNGHSPLREKPDLRRPVPTSRNCGLLLHALPSSGMLVQEYLSQAGGLIRCAGPFHRLARRPNTRHRRASARRMARHWRPNQPRPGPALGIGRTRLRRRNYNSWCRCRRYSGSGSSSPLPPGRHRPAPSPEDWHPAIAARPSLPPDALRQLNRRLD